MTHAALAWKGEPNFWKHDRKFINALKRVYTDVLKVSINQLTPSPEVIKKQMDAGATKQQATADAISITAADLIADIGMLWHHVHRFERGDEFRRSNPRRKSEADTKKTWLIGQQINNLRTAMELTIFEFAQLVTKDDLHPNSAYMLEKALPRYELGAQRCNTITLKKMSNLAKRHGIPFKISRSWMSKAAQERYKRFFNKEGYIRRNNPY